MLLPGPDEVGEVIANTFKPLPDISVVQHAGRLLTLAVSDCPFRRSPDPDALGTGDLSVGEPVFAPTPGTRSSERGHWLTFATDRTDSTSRLLVLPADDPAQGPVARVRIPLGLHGTWLPTEE
jgi:carotenoid cleavage dioxygenase-like enzyme